MSKSKPQNTSEKESEVLRNIDRELKDLIDKNESFKKGISKLFSEIEKQTPIINHLEK